MNAYIDTIKVTDENGEKAILYPRTKQEAVEGLEQRLVKLEVADITETEDTTLEDSNAGRLLFTEIDGAMEQGENPSPTNQQEIRNVSISGIRTHDGNGNESSITFSQPINLYGLDDVRDILTSKQIGRKLKSITLTGNEDWRTSAGGQAYYFYIDDGAIGDITKTIYSTHFTKGRWLELQNGEICLSNGITACIGVATASFASVDELKSFLANNEVEVVYELANETTEELPIADQIALNSLQTFDGITYVEFISEIQPTFNAKYGTTEMGGMTLESLLTARSNDLRLSAVESAVINNI